jgi:predicted nucleotidyltransferase
MISYNEAIKIAQEFSMEVAGRFPEKIVAVFAFGSLGSDYYRPGQSDIDTAVITNCERHDVPQIERGN